LRFFRLLIVQYYSNIIHLSRVKGIMSLIQATNSERVKDKWRSQSHFTSN